MSQLAELMGCNHGWAAERARIALQVEEEYLTGQLSKSEYKEILEDLVNTDRLDEEATDIEVKAVLVAGIYGLLQVI